MIELEDLAQGRGQAAREARRTLKRRARAAARGSSGADDFAPLLDALDGIADRIAPAQQRALGREIATDLRKANADRIRRNVQPPVDEPMQPRKKRLSKSQGKGVLRGKKLRDKVTRAKRTVRKDAMFRRATAPAYLRKESSQGEAQVGFVGAMARIMAVHQYGQADTVTRDPSSPRVVYPERVVLGITAEDRAHILDQVTARVAP